MGDSHLYSRLLLSKGLGYPLWFPEPYDDLPRAYRETGIRVGDVGIISSTGSFDFIFNICVAADDPINVYGVPERFEPIVLGRNEIGVRQRRFSPGSDISTTTITKKRLDTGLRVEGDGIFVPAGAGVNLQISSSSREGAFLFLPDGASSSDLRPLDLFRTYAQTHAARWYQFVNGPLRRMARSGSLYLITGADKAVSWGVACFSNTAAEDQVSLQFTAAKVGGCHMACMWTAETVSPVDHRAGPERSEEEYEWAENQAVFVRGFKIAVREPVAFLKEQVKVTSIEAAKSTAVLSNSSSIPYGGASWTRSTSMALGSQKGVGPDDQDVTVEYFPEMPDIYHPSDVINDYLLAFDPKATVAVTHDEEWINLLDLDAGDTPDAQTILLRVNEKCSVESHDGILSLKPHIQAPTASSGSTDIALPHDIGIWKDFTGEPLQHMNKDPASTSQHPTASSSLTDISLPHDIGMWKDFTSGPVTVQYKRNDAVSADIFDLFNPLAQPSTKSTDHVVPQQHPQDTGSDNLRYQAGTGPLPIRHSFRALSSAAGEPSMKEQARKAPEGENRAQLRTVQDKSTRLPGACTRCKALKAKCEFPAESEYCRRCLTGGHKCTVQPLNKGKGRVVEGAVQEEQEGHRRTKHNTVLGACTRCKLLKIKCQFSANATSCRQCATQRYLCVVLGQKLRHDAPPLWKRQRLLSQIRDQAAQMQILLANLEETRATSSEHTPALTEHSYSSPSTTAWSPSPPPPPTSYSDSGHAARIRSATPNLQGSKDEWIVNARESMRRFGDLMDLPEIPMKEHQMGRTGVGKRTWHDSATEDADVEDVYDASGVEASVTDHPAPVATTYPDKGLSYQVPDILAGGIITPAESEKLFQIYFKEMNTSTSLLDPVLYTLSRTSYRSPFLFTVICAVASPFWDERPELPALARQHAELAAGRALVSGNKNVEMCQAYLLLSLYPPPKVKDWRSGQYLSLAITTAMDLSLHLPIANKPRSENHARELLNRTRTWLNCFNLDRSMSILSCKPSFITTADYISSHCQDWWRSSPCNLPNFDVHISAHAAQLNVMARFMSKLNSNLEEPLGLNKEMDFEAIATEADEELMELWENWNGVLSEHDMSDPQNSFRTDLLKLSYHCARIIVFSYGFQHASWRNGGMDENTLLNRCLAAASGVVHAFIDDIYHPNQAHYWKRVPEMQNVFITFASVLLVKLLQPKFAAYMTIEEQGKVRALVQRVAIVFGSSELATDDGHGPMLYSHLLRNLLATPTASVEAILKPSPFELLGPYASLPSLFK